MIAYDRYTELLGKRIHRTITASEMTNPKKLMRLNLLLLALATLLFAGCSTTVTYNSSYGRQITQHLSPRYPGKVLLLTTKAEDQFAVRETPKSVTGFALQLNAPLGEITKKSAGTIYGSMFESGYEFGDRVDTNKTTCSTIIHPQILDFSWRMNQAKNAGFAITPQVKMTLNLQLLSPETNGVIWDRQFESGWVDGNSYVVNFSPMESVNEALQRTIVTLMTDSLRDLDTVLRAGNGTSSRPPIHPSPSSGGLAASGTGFFITDDGYLLSNAHVVEGAKRVEVKLNGSVYAAQVIKRDPVNDIAILKVSGEFPSLPLRSDSSVQLGESVFTVGFPDPALQGIEPKLTDGRISSLAGLADDPRYYQVSLPVQPGNSGGALVDARGAVVGIVSARLSDRAALAYSGALPQNVNYAVKIGYARILLDSLSDVAAKMKPSKPIEGRKFEDLVKEVQSGTAQILVY